MSVTRIGQAFTVSSGSGSGTANSIVVNQTGHGFAIGDIVRLVSGFANTYTKAQADSAANAEVVGIVTAVKDANQFTLTTEGVVTTGVPIASAGTVMFLDPTTAGTLTSTEPSTTGQISKPLAIIIASNSRMLFSNFRGEVLTSSSGGGGSPLTVQEIDGTPSVANVTTINVTNGTLTDNGGGVITVTTGGGSGGTPGGSNTQVQFNDSGVFGGDAGFVYNKSTDTATLGNLITGSFATAYVSKSTNYTATINDYLIACDASGGGFTVTLPAASGNTGLQLLVKKIDTSGNIITVDGNASETIDGSTTKSINTQYETLAMESNGSNWYLI